MGKKDRGFKSMDVTKQRAIATEGGRLCHVQRPGKRIGHEWTSAEAATAGRKGGLVSAAVQRAKRQAGK